jgi:hypothetical protein
MRGSPDEFCRRPPESGRVAAFHAEVEAGQHIAAFGQFEVVARENRMDAVPQVGVTRSRTVFDWLWSLTEEALGHLRL